MEVTHAHTVRIGEADRCGVFEADGFVYVTILGEEGVQSNARPMVINKYITNNITNNTTNDNSVTNNTYNVRTTDNKPAREWIDATTGLPTTNVANVCWYKAGRKWRGAEGSVFYGTLGKFRSDGRGDNAIRSGT